MNVNSIHIVTNLSAQAKHPPVRTIASFYPDVGPGYKFTYRPFHLEYIDMGGDHHIQRAKTEFLDQNLKPVSFQGEEITIKYAIREKEKHHT